MTPVRLPSHSPNLNAHAERWVKSVKDENVSRLILFGKTSLRRALREFSSLYHGERSHKSKDIILVLPCTPACETRVNAAIACCERLSALLKHYHREAVRVF